VAPRNLGPVWNPASSSSARSAWSSVFVALRNWTAIRSAPLHSAPLPPRPEFGPFGAAPSVPGAHQRPKELERIRTGPELPSAPLPSPTPWSWSVRSRSVRSRSAAPRSIILSPSLAPTYTRTHGSDVLTIGVKDVGVGAGCRHASRRTSMDENDNCEAAGTQHGAISTSTNRKADNCRGYQRAARCHLRFHEPHWGCRGGRAVCSPTPSTLPWTTWRTLVPAQSPLPWTMPRRRGHRCQFCGHALWRHLHSHERRQRWHSLRLQTASCYLYFREPRNDSPKDGELPESSPVPSSTPQAARRWLGCQRAWHEDIVHDCPRVDRCPFHFHELFQRWRWCFGNIDVRSGAISTFPNASKSCTMNKGLGWWSRHSRCAAYCVAFAAPACRCFRACLDWCARTSWVYYVQSYTLHPCLDAHRCLHARKPIHIKPTRHELICTCIGCACTSCLASDVWPSTNHVRQFEKVWKLSRHGIYIGITLLLSIKY
jgi:hypothetical protein